MKSFKSYASEQTSEKEKRKGNESASAEDLTKQIASAYHGKSNADMLKSILAEAEKSKRAVLEQCAASVCLIGADELPALGEAPFFAGCHPFATSIAVDQLSRYVGFAEYMQQELGGTYMVTPVLPQQPDIDAAVEAAANASCIVLCTYNAHLRRGQVALMQALGRLGKPMIVCAMANPYDLGELPEGACGLTAFEYNVPTLSVLRDVLCGKRKPEGTLSVSL